MKKIAFLINNLGVGGAERVFVRDANTFARKGHEVTFFFLYGDPDKQPLSSELDPKVRKEAVNARGPFDFAAGIRVARMCKARGIRTVISTLNDANCVGRWAVIASFGRIHLFLREANDPIHKLWWQRILSALFDWTATRIIAVTGQVRSGLLKDAPWRGRKIVVLHNGIDVPPQRQRISHTPIRILSVGSLSSQKDHATLLDAVSTLLKKGVACETVIVGEGLYHDELREQAASLKGVHFVGEIGSSELAQEYDNADVFALTSRWEGCPNVVLEAMAHGLPVVATNVGGVPELVENGVTGLLVPPRDPRTFADALKRLAADAKLRDSLGAAGYERARSLFSNEKRFERLVALVGE